MNSNFDNKQFKKILRKAMGDEGRDKFAASHKIDLSAINDYLFERLDVPPTPSICKKISYNENNVSFEELMLSAGYSIEEANNFNLKEMIF